VNNLNSFLQLAAGLDDYTWRYHLERGDYSNWLSSSIKDEGLGDVVKRIEENRSLSRSIARRDRQSDRGALHRACPMRLRNHPR
jgi:hypothetical protein